MMLTQLSQFQESIAALVNFHGYSKTYKSQWRQLDAPGSAKANGREPKSCLGQVFNFKLGHFVMYAMVLYIQKHALA